MDRKVLAVASQGGHWQQLETLIPAFENCHTFFASTTRDRPDVCTSCRYYPLPNANRRMPLKVFWLFVTSACLIIRLRPDVIISTGALPGLACIFWGRFFGTRTLWIDSIANADRLSLSGRIAKYLASATLSQWPDLGRMTGVEYRGAVL